MYHVELIVRVTSGSSADTPEDAIRRTREIMMSQISPDVLRIEVIEVRAEKHWDFPQMSLWGLIKLAWKRH